ncbi:ATP-binding protein [Fontisphaera persica]|uniref:hybrid sensor histidine kinase/response regulator n=1 Tax=Fontisphaera persica TaxID=2974023 RepID=UPI0024BF9D1F|nr:ATP-binding protein [Fontisphaera persica]WCJ58170.1 ATP-binding protein [Fontisphaera persica]
MAQSHSVRGPASMVLDNSGKVRWWGQNAVHLFQIPAALAAGCPWWELLPLPLRQPAQQAWQNAKNNGGGHFAFADPAAPAAMAWGLALEPMADPLLHETLWHAQLEAPAPDPARENGLLEAAAFDAMKDALVIVQDGRIAGLNLAAEDFFGLSREQAMGQPLAALGISLDPAQLLQENRQGETGGSWWISVRRGSAEPEAAPVETDITPLRSVQAPAFLLRFRQPAQQLMLRKGLLRAQQTQSLGPVINGVIHDFNNYFTAILSNLDLAETCPSVAPDCLTFIRNARTASQNGAEVIRHLQLFSRKSAGHPELLDPRVLLEEIITLMQHCLGRAVRVARLQVNTAPGLVLGRPGLLRQLLINLCLNAREAMPCGGELSFTLDKVEFATSEADSPRRPGVFARITISDTGHGMPPEVLARLQQPFFTTHADREMGLGLFAVNEILTLHHGWLEVESQKAKGTRVHVFLPARPPTTRPEPLAQDALLLQQKKLEGTERVLVVEPDPATLMLLKAVLGYRGYQVQAAGSGQEALQAASGAGPVQLLLVDMNLPDMTAWQLMNQLRHAWPELKVIFLVQETTPELLSLAQRVQASLLAKPIENQRLLSLIRECLEKAG